MTSTDLAAYDFELPETHIALRPVEPQDAARMLVVHADGRIEDARVRDLPKYLSPQDIMVFNDTRVIPAALIVRASTCEERCPNEERCSNENDQR